MVFIKKHVSPACTWLICALSSGFGVGSRYLMQTLRPQAPEVPHHVRVFHVGLGVPLLRVDEGRELHSA